VSVRRHRPAPTPDHPAWPGGDVGPPERKQAISLRVDRDVLAWFRSTGPRYQSRMNAVLRSYMLEQLRREVERREAARRALARRRRRRA
jgi:uncharacterized protein (DUF4415 family)